MRFKNYLDLKKELDKMPPADSIITVNGFKWLKYDYVIDRMNEIYGEGNWNLENLHKKELKNDNGELIGNACDLELTFKDPITCMEIRRTGVSGTYGKFENDIIGKALLDAVASIGNTFGRFLSDQVK
jgi:hypothetical protein